MSWCFRLGASFNTKCHDVVVTSILVFLANIHSSVVVIIMFSRMHRIISILIIALFAAMTISMVSTCQIESMSINDITSTKCHHRTTTSVMPFSCCLMAVLPAEIERPLEPTFVAFVLTPVVLQPLPPSFPLFIPPRTLAS